MEPARILFDCHFLENLRGFGQPMLTQRPARHALSVECCIRLTMARRRNASIITAYLPFRLKRYEGFS
jgi:hypothetical protein